MLRTLAAFAILGFVLADHHHHGGASSEEQLAGDKPWIGKWESTGREENFQAFINALQVPLSGGLNDKVYHKFWKDGNHYHHKINIPSIGYKNQVEFQLGVEGTSNFNNTQFKYKYDEEPTGLHATYTLVAKGKTIDDHYKITGDELEKTYSTGGVSAKRWYQRVKKQ